MVVLLLPFALFFSPSTGPVVWPGIDVGSLFVGCMAAARLAQKSTALACWRSRIFSSDRRSQGAWPPSTMRFLTHATRTPLARRELHGAIREYGRGGCTRGSDNLLHKRSWKRLTFLSAPAIIPTPTLGGLADDETKKSALFMDLQSKGGLRHIPGIRMLRVQRAIARPISQDFGWRAVSRELPTGKNGWGIFTEAGSQG